MIFSKHYIWTCSCTLDSSGYFFTTSGEEISRKMIWDLLAYTESLGENSNPRAVSQSCRGLSSIAPPENVVVTLTYWDDGSVFFIFIALHYSCEAGYH